jgi:hypothetical protein
MARAGGYAHGRLFRRAPFDARALGKVEGQESSKNKGKNLKCRRAEIFAGVHPPVFADVGELKDLQAGFAYGL